MGELHGHTEYIYALDILPSGDIVSSGEDRTVRIWRNAECIQTIIHPALSIWSVAVCPETGDIVSGASDKIVRVWSRNPERQADQEVRHKFDKVVTLGTCFRAAVCPCMEPREDQTGLAVEFLQSFRTRYLIPGAHVEQTASQPKHLIHACFRALFADCITVS